MSANTPQVAVNTFNRSIKMISMHEALARERVYESQRLARRERVASQMAAARRWRRLERFARAAHRRRVHSALAAADGVRWE